MARVYVVQRAFEAQGRVLQAGEVVDASGWRNLTNLLRDRRLRPADELPSRNAYVPASKGKKAH